MHSAAVLTGQAGGPADAIDFKSVRRVLVIKLRHHGDVLLSTPVFTALAAAAPGVEIDALVYRETLPLLEHNRDLAQVFTIDRNWKKSGVIAQARAEARLLATLRARRHDLVIHLTEHTRGAWLTRLLRPRWSVAPARRAAGRFWARSFTHLYRGSASAVPGSSLIWRHTVEHNLDALRRLGVCMPTSPPLQLQPGPAALQAAQHTIAAAGFAAGQFVLIQPTSRWFFKTWPVAQNATLIATLLQQGESILLSCAPDMREQAMVEAIMAEVRAQLGAGSGDLQRLARTPADLALGQLAALIGQARLFVGIDSAPMHMAAAMGTPVVALFGPSSEKTWGPWQVRHEIVTHPDYPCRPCGQDGCGGGKVSDCLARLPVAPVLAAIARVGDGAGSSL